jgi:hypothetical protein
MPVPPWEYTPSLFHSSSVAPLPFQGFNNRPDREFSELCSCCWVEEVGCPKNDTFSVSLSSRVFILQSLPGDSTKDDYLISLIISRKLFGDSTDDEANHEFSMGPEKFQTPRHE